LSVKFRILKQPVLLLCAHPSCSYYYLLSPSIQFFAHHIVLHFLFHCTLYSYFSFFTIYMLLCCYFYIIFIFIILHCPLSGPDFTYISLLIIPCIIYYVTNKETLNLELKTLLDTESTLCLSLVIVFYPFIKVTLKTKWKKFKLNWKYKLIKKQGTQQNG